MVVDFLKMLIHLLRINKDHGVKAADGMPIEYYYNILQKFKKNDPPMAVEMIFLL